MPRLYPWTVLGHWPRRLMLSGLYWKTCTKSSPLLQCGHQGRTHRSDSLPQTATGPRQMKQMNQIWTAWTKWCLEPRGQPNPARQVAVDLLTLSMRIKDYNFKLRSLGLIVMQHGRKSWRMLFCLLFLSPSLPKISEQQLCARNCARGWRFMRQGIDYLIFTVMLCDRFVTVTCVLWMWKYCTERWCQQQEAREPASGRAGEEIQAHWPESLVMPCLLWASVVTESASTSCGGLTPSMCDGCDCGGERA